MRRRLLLPLVGLFCLRLPRGSKRGRPGRRVLLRSVLCWPIRLRLLLLFMLQRDVHHHHRRGFLHVLSRRVCLPVHLVERVLGLFVWHVFPGRAGLLYVLSCRTGLHSHHVERVYNVHVREIFHRRAILVHHLSRRVCLRLGQRGPVRVLRRLLLHGVPDRVHGVPGRPGMRLHQHWTHRHVLGRHLFHRRADCVHGVSRRTSVHIHHVQCGIGLRGWVVFHRRAILVYHLSRWVCLRLGQRGSVRVRGRLLLHRRADCVHAVSSGTSMRSDQHHGDRQLHRGYVLRGVANVVHHVSRGVGLRQHDVRPRALRAGFLLPSGFRILH